MTARISSKNPASSFTKPPNLIYEKNIKNPIQKIPESLTNLQTFKPYKPSKPYILKTYYEGLNIFQIHVSYTRDMGISFYPLAFLPPVGGGL
jgi:hypothetical protein